MVRGRPDQPPEPKVLRIAIIGAPNAGKSTLSNQLLGRKVKLPQITELGLFDHLYFLTVVAVRSFQFLKGFPSLEESAHNPMQSTRCHHA